ncbi:MAG: hypothetical protein IJ545_06990 [Alphaproteobacteria bacterium]|nr:hypothetical protein [Alphaproteobacteria bacterium]
MTIKEKCQAAGIALPTYYFRIKQGMTPEEALSIPNKRPGRRDYRAGAKKTTPEIQEKIKPAPTIKYGSQTSYIFESDWQKNHRKAKSIKPAPAQIPAPKAKPYYGVKSSGGNTPNNTLVRTPAPAAQPETSENYVNVSSDAEFNRVLGGYTAVILNTPKRGEYKYQIHGNGVRLYTSSAVKFVNQIIRICDPQGKIGFRVVEE